MTLEGSGGQPHSPLGTCSTPRAPLLKGKQAPGWLWEVGDPEPWVPLEQVDPLPQISGPIRFDAKGQRAPRLTGMGVLETCALPSAPQPWLALSAWAGISHRLQGAPGDTQWSHFCTKSGACAHHVLVGPSPAYGLPGGGLSGGGQDGLVACVPVAHTLPARHLAPRRSLAKEEEMQGRGACARLPRCGQRGPQGSARN